jgi:hypothetical protein
MLIVLIYQRWSTDKQMAKKNEIPEKRRFTLRLTDVECTAIEEIKSIVHETTDSAVLEKK